MAQSKPALGQGAGDTVHAVFVDERTRSTDDDLPQAGVYYTRVTGGQPGAVQRLDTGTPATLAAKLHNAWAPRIAARGRSVLVSWIDFLNYDWGVFSRQSSDGGGTFGSQIRVTDNTEGSTQQEELADSPDPALLPGPFVAWTDWRKRDSAQTKPHQEYDIYAATPGAPNRQVDPYGARQVSTHQMTDAEQMVWGKLRSRRFAGFKFRRQAPLDHYIVDFVCFSRRLIVELDGGQHAQQESRDRERDKWFRQRGAVLEFGCD